MNRKNLTAAVFAGLAGVAGIAGTAQAVNLNPDGLGQLLIYPYYTSNDGNQTVLSVVNTTDQAKAVKVRFIEGFNSREVLDFNLYLSREDVWVAAIADGGDLGFEEQAGVPHLVVPDTSCTVPYLYGMGKDAGLDFGLQAFLPYAYTGSFEDGGPTGIERASEGYIEMIEMGVLTDRWYRAPGTLSSSDPGRMGAATAATHLLDDDTGISEPADCSILVRNWTDYDLAPEQRADLYDGHWYDDAYDTTGCALADNVLETDVCKTDRETARNTGGLFGGGAVIDAENGTMYSYNAKAVQGFDKSDPNASFLAETAHQGMHYIPGSIHPSLNDGDQYKAYVFFGTPSNDAVKLEYPSNRTVEAVSAVFMHDRIMNEFSVQADLNASSEWILTFPTKSWYVDELLVGNFPDWTPNPDDPGCNGWDLGEPYPFRDGPDYTDQIPGPGHPDYDPNWEQCTYLKNVISNAPIPPFTEEWLGLDTACEIIGYGNWDREELPFNKKYGERPPVVSPAPPDPDTPDTPEFELCYEVNVIRFTDGGDVFGTTSEILATVGDTPETGWAMLNLSYFADFKDGAGFIERHQDRNGLVGLPVLGFWAYEIENNFLEGGVKANYGGLFDHKGSVKRINPSRCYHTGLGCN